MAEYGRMLGCGADEAQGVIDELARLHICDSVTDGNGTVTLINRRMAREEKERQQGRIRVVRHRDGQKKRDCNTDVTPPSSSSSSTSSSKERRIPPTNPDAEWIEELKGSPTYSGIDIDRELSKCTEWWKVREVTVTRERFVNWLNKVERPLKATTAPSQRKPPVIVPFERHTRPNSEPTQIGKMIAKLHELELNIPVEKVSDGSK
jgi:hypothetical protein